jgi:hypothetical protein
MLKFEIMIFKFKHGLYLLRVYLLDGSKMLLWGHPTHECTEFQCLQVSVFLKSTSF